MIRLTVIFLSLVTIVSCAKHNKACKKAAQDFDDIFKSLNGDTRNTMDTEVHEYTFSLSSDKEVCEIGYQSQRRLREIPYKIEIEEVNTGIVIYSEEFEFSANRTSYVIPSQTINLSANTSYQLRRVQTNWLGNIANTIGKIKRDVVFPLQSGDLTILSSNFYDEGDTTVNDIGFLPYIDIVFKP